MTKYATEEVLGARAARMKALWQDEGFRARMAQRHRRSKAEIQEARAMRLTKANLRQQKAAERAARRETRELRRQERERERQEKRETRERRQAEKLERASRPLPRIHVDPENFGLNWKALRLMTVTIEENGKIIRRRQCDIGD